MTHPQAEPDYLRLRQICLVAPELEPAVEEMGAVLGLQVCHRDPNVAVFGLANALFAAGTTFLEIVAPIRSGTAAGRFLERTGRRGGYIVIFDCRDPDARQAHAASIGVATAYEIDRPGYKGVQLHPSACRAAMLEFDRTEGGEALDGTYWPAGGDGWQRHVDTRVTRGIVGVEVISPAPAELAAHWGAILGRPAQDSRSIELDLGKIAFVSSQDGSERLETIVLEATDRGRIMGEANKRGCAIDAETVRLSGMNFRIW
jgi:hypothetical protein